MLEIVGLWIAACIGYLVGQRVAKRRFLKLLAEFEGHVQPLLDNQVLRGQGMVEMVASHCNEIERIINRGAAQ